MSFRNAKRYNMAKARTHVVVMTTLFMEKLAVENTGKVGFTHVFPGVVITPAFGNQDLPRWFKAVWFIMEPIAKLTMAVSPEEIGERVVYLASQRYPPRNSQPSEEKGGLSTAMSTDGVRGGGAYACTHDGETVDVRAKYKVLKDQKMDQKVWDHTLAVFREIKSDGKFTG